MEKGYKAWGSELTTEISLIEADMRRFIRKEGGYIGSLVVQQKKKDGVPLHLVYCQVEADDADPMGNEPIYDGDDIIGITTSGAYGHCVKKSLMFAYVNSGFESPGTSFEVSILGKRKKTIVLAKPAWDPANTRLKA